MSTVVTVDRYVESLYEHFAGDPGEFGLLHAYELGRALVAQGAGLLDVVALHAQALAQYEMQYGQELPRSLTAPFLAEVLGPYEMAYLGFQEANTSLRALTASVDVQVDERARQLQESFRTLQGTAADRRRLLARFAKAQEAERHRLTDELHDTVQIMTAVARQLTGLRPQIDTDEQPLLDQVDETVAAAVSRLGKLVSGLRPPALDHEGLAAAVEVYTGHIYDASTEVVICDQLEDHPPVATRELLYRVIQEALANVSEHANARRVQVHLETDRAGIRATVSDDGEGFDPQALRNRPGRLGISAMRERAEMAGGWCMVNSLPGEGTSVVCWVPAEPVTRETGDQELGAPRPGQL